MTLNDNNKTQHAGSAESQLLIVIDNIQDNSGKLDTGIKLKQLLKKITTIGTWNVRTLQQYGKIIEL